MNKDLLNAFEALRVHYGSHCAAARNIGIAQDHYRAMRNGRVKIPQRTADYIILKASELESGPALTPPAGLQSARVASSKPETTSCSK